MLYGRRGVTLLLPVPVLRKQRRAEVDVCTLDAQLLLDKSVVSYMLPDRAFLSGYMMLENEKARGCVGDCDVTIL